MSIRGLYTLPTAAAVIAAALLMQACGGKKKDSAGDIGNTRLYPTVATDDVSTYVSDSGYTRYHITAPRWLMYEEADTPYWDFPDGLYMERYDDAMEVDATFRADSARYWSALKLWRFDGRVNMRNAEGDRFATPQLFWDQNRSKVYSDSFMHIDRQQRVIEGYGFESNEQMTTYTILHPQMILPVDRSRKSQISEQPDVSDRSDGSDVSKLSKKAEAPAPAPAPAPVNIDKKIGGEIILDDEEPRLKHQRITRDTPPQSTTDQ